MITKEEVLTVAEIEGPQYAHDLLLMTGPDNFIGTYIEYIDLLEKLEKDSAWRV